MTTGKKKIANKIAELSRGYNCSDMQNLSILPEEYCKPLQRPWRRRAKKSGRFIKKLVQRAFVSHG